MGDWTNLSMLSPWLCLALGVLITMLTSSIRIETKAPARITTLLTFLSSMVASWILFSGGKKAVIGGILEVSTLSTMTVFLISFLGLIFTAGFSRYLEKEKIHISDYYNLTLLMALGASVLVATKDLFTLFLALELMSLPAYSLVGFRRNDSRSNEASIKYFILGGAIGAIYLMGTSFVFGASGSTQLSVIHEWSKNYTGDVTLFVVGHLLILFGFLFKVAAAPFHFWKPDVYEGAPVSVTGLMATIITTASFVVLVRLFSAVDYTSPAFSAYLESMKSLIKITAVLSLMVGSTILILQRNIKRMLAYSSINHTGYLLLGLLGTIGNPSQVYSIWFYLAGYSLITAGMFLMLSQSEFINDRGMELVDLTGMMKRNPAFTAIMTVFLFSMAGMPFTVGFFTKYSVFMSSISAGEVGFVILGAICTVVAAYGYLRPVALMVMRDPDPNASSFSSGKLDGGMVIGLAFLCLILGVFPQYLIEITKGFELIP